MNVKYTYSHYMEYATNKNMTGDNSISIMHCPLSYCTEMTTLQWVIRRRQSILHPNWLERANQLQQILI